MEWFQLLVSLLVITVGADALVRGASFLALRMGVSPLFVGLTIVGFGTSSPELASSLFATARGSIDVSVGNVLGSNIFNVCVIVGIAALIRPIRVQLSAVRRDLLVAIAAGAAPWASLAFGASLPRAVGAAFLSFLFGYLTVAYRSSRRASSFDVELAKDGVLDTVATPKPLSRLLKGGWANAAFVVGGLLFLGAGSRMFVGAALEIARSIGVSDLVIGLTVVSGGTSLPELVTSIVAGARRNPDIAIGNIIGSNIFNVFGILGVCAVVRPQVLVPQAVTIDVPVMLAATLALIPIIRSGGVISRWEGVCLLAGYGVYLATLMIRSG